MCVDFGRRTFGLVIKSQRAVEYQIRKRRDNMKKRFLLVLLTIILVGCFALVACQFPVMPPTDDDKGWGEVFTLETAYAEAQSLGYTGSLTDFLDSIRGKDGQNGEPGADGIGIKSVAVNSEGKLIVTLSNDIVIDCGSVKGEQGPAGPQGPAGENGADGVTPQLKIGEDNYWYVSYDNGTTWTSLGVKATGENGTNGSNGSAGENGADGVTPQLKIGEDNYWYVSYDNGATWTSLEVKATGSNGSQGAAGNGIASILKTSMDGLVDTYTITFTDGTTTTFTVTNGKDGQDGAQGIQGIQGVPGVDGHTPVITIQNGYWYIDGVNTNVLAEGIKGETGNGISSIEKTSSEGLVDTYTITFTDGTTTTFTVTNGKDGQDGAQGIQGIQGEPGKDGHTPVITIQNGYWYIDGVNTNVLAEGIKGETGNGISSIEKTSTEGLVDTYTITFTDGSTTTFTVTNGSQGEVGPQGPSGVTPQLKVGEDNYWYVSYDNGATWTSLGVKATGENGANGSQGNPGETGPQGPQGAQGVSIVSTAFDENGNMVITYSDGTTQVVEHNWQKLYVLEQANCQTDGKELYSCTDCGLVRVIITPQTGHTDGEWITDLEPTCTEDGSKHQVCAVCGETLKTESIDATGHSYVATVVDPTCITQGYTLHTCSVCGDSYEDSYVEAIGSHNFQESDTCENCGLNIADVAVDVYNMSATTDDNVKGYIVARTDGNYDVYIKGTGAMKDYSNGPLNVDDYIVINAYINNGVTSIGNSAFYGCSSLISMEIPDSVTIIGSYAFEYCRSLTSITIPSDVTSIGVLAFSNTGYYNNEANWQDKVLYIDNFLIAAKSTIESCTIKEGTTVIADYAFYNCSSLVIITIPEGLTSIGARVFANCTSLTSIAIPKGVTSIGDNAFFYCTSLESITIPDGVTSIGDNTFNSCSNLTSITIPSSLTSIGNLAFNYCSSLTNVYYAGTEEQWNSITIDSSNTYLTNANIVFNHPDHNYVPVVTAPTCTEQGYTTHICHCGDSYVDSYMDIDPTAHSYTSVVTVPTCTEQGYTTHTCDRCGDSFVDTYVDALGHDEIEHDAQEPACTEIGWDEYVTCSRCDYTTYNEIPATDHIFGKWITVTEVTSTEAGLQQRTCKCGEVETRDMSFVYDAYGYSDLANNSNGQAMQQLYLSIYNACEKFASNKEDVEAVDGSYLIEAIDISGMEITDAVAVWKVFYVENPIYYWLSNTLKVNAEDLLLCIDQDYATVDCREQCDLAIKDMVQDCNSNITVGMSDLGKALAIHDFICTRMNYAYESDGVTPQDDIWAHNMIGCAKYNLGVCESYAKTYQYLCSLNGIECITVTGFGGDEKHAWNLININDTWYGVDATWNDTGTEELSYSCFGMAKEYLDTDHTAESFESTGEDYLYRLPEVSSRSLELVDLHKGDTLVGTFGNIDEAFAAMDDEKGDYTIDLYEYELIGPLLISFPSIVHSINSSETPNVKSITIKGTYIGFGGGGTCTQLNINGAFKLQADTLILQDIIPIGEEPLYIQDNCLEITGEFSYVHIPIIGNIEDGTTSKIVCNSDITEFYCDVKVYQIVGNRPVLIRAKAHVIHYVGRLSVFGGDMYVENLHYNSVDSYSVGIEPGASSSKFVVDNIYGNDYLDIIISFGNLEEYPLITIGNTNCKINLFLHGEITTVIKDVWGNTIGHSVESANPFNVECAIATLKDSSVSDKIAIEYLIENSYIDKSHMYEVNTQGEIVLKQYTNIDDCIIMDTTLVHYAGSQTEVIIPAVVTSIGERAFYGCSSLTSITIPDSVTSIGSDAFCGCSNLTIITIPSSVTSIGEWAFQACTNITSITVLDGITSIGHAVFWGCTSLTNIIIPASVTSIGSYAFYVCESLTDVYYTGTQEQWEVISIGSDNTSLTDANRYYYSETQPTTSGNYWHYVDGVPTKW